jgi:hypothetical protein
VIGNPSKNFVSTGAKQVLIERLFRSNELPELSDGTINLKVVKSSTQRSQHNHCG